MTGPRAHTPARRTRVGIISTLLVSVLAVAAAALLASGTGSAPPNAAAATPAGAAATATGIPATLPLSTRSGAATAQRWSAIGATVPFLHLNDDFSGGANGLRAHEVEADRMLRTMSERGVRVVRWYLFPGAAAPIARAADGTPTRVAPGALADLDLAVRLATKYDVYLVPVVLPHPASVPATWFTTPTQTAALAAALTPMFARYRPDAHLLGWELTSNAETIIGPATVSRDQYRAALPSLVNALHATAPQLAIAGAASVDRLDDVTGLGFDAYAPQATATSGPACAICRSVASLATTEGVDAPVFIGGFDAASPAQATLRLQQFAKLGYAGALSFSWRTQGSVAETHPAGSKVNDAALWKWHYSHPTSGPRARPLNPCIGPDAKVWRCPNLTMSRPYNLSLGTRGGRTVLFSANSLNSVGNGPASLHGTRNGRYTMSAKQLLHRANGTVASVATGAKLMFKAVPGQYRYWKWNGAARMELWRLDSTGTPVERVRTGPKTVYCLRDLKHTRPGMRRSPGLTYPGCSQSLGAKGVTLGASVGWSDVYPATYNENWIDVQGLRGCFAYVHIADPTNVMYETNERDNTSRVTVKLPFTGSSKGCPGAKPLPTQPGDGGIY